MTLSTTTLIWIAALVLLAIVGWWIWRARMRRDEPAVMPEVVAEAQREVTRRPPPPPTAAPPPALAGPNPHGQAKPGTPAKPPPPRTSQPPPAAAGGPPASRKVPSRAPSANGANPLSAVASWGYQLQRLDLDRAAASPYDLLVVDYSKDGSDEKALRQNELERLRRKPDGGRRLLLAYLSIGEAESYRSYWDPSWSESRPAWLLSENPEWKENFAVCFWDPGWQRLMCGSPGSFLDKLIAAGFDGAYLDKCDVFEDLERRERKAARSRPDLEADMVGFVVHLSRYAKSKARDFLIVMQNAENLLEHEALRASIDGVAKEELLFGLNGPQRKNPKAEIDHARRALDLAKNDGKPVLLVEYLDDPAKLTEAARYAADAGYVLYVAPKDRELDRLNYRVLEA